MPPLLSIPIVMDTNTIINVLVVLVGIAAFDYYKSGAVFGNLEEQVQELFAAGVTLPFNWKINLLNFSGAVLCCMKYKSDLKVPKSAFETLLVCVLFRYGGTVMAGLLMGQPGRWILAPTGFSSLAVAWWLVFFCPLNLFSLIVDKAPFIKFLLGFLTTIAVAQGISVIGMDSVLASQYHTNSEDIAKSYVLAIACGTLCGCGGALIYDALNLSSSTASFTLSRTASIFEIDKYAASSAFNRAFLLAVLYYALLNPFDNMPWDFRSSGKKAQLVIVLLSVGNFIIQSLFPQIDVFQLITNFLLSVTGITPIITPTSIPTIAAHLPPNDVKAIERPNVSTPNQKKKTKKSN